MKRLPGARGGIAAVCPNPYDEEARGACAMPTSQRPRPADSRGAPDRPLDGDSRRHPRFSVDVDARVSLASGQRVAARTRDVSRAGICLIGASAVPVGSALSLELVLAFGDNAFSEPLALSARVVWCTPIGQSFQIGVMFDELTEDQDNFLDMFLQFLDGTLGPREGEDAAADGHETSDDDE